MSVLSLFSSEPKKSEPKKQDGLERHPVDITGLSADLDFNKTYNQLAQKLGVISRAGIASAELLAVLAEESIAIYDRDRVEAYMDKKGYWGWFPLRHDDVRYSNSIGRVTHNDHPSIYGGGKSDIYRPPVPYPVLVTVGRIWERTHNCAFFVAAPDIHPDPFLGAMALEDSAMYVIERWDEPSFR
jgi:hypothetical protein